MRPLRLPSPATTILLAAAFLLAGLAMRWELLHLDEAERAAGAAHLIIDLSLAGALLSLACRWLAPVAFLALTSGFVLLTALSPLAPRPTPFATTCWWPELLTAVAFLSMTALSAAAGCTRRRTPRERPTSTPVARDAARPGADAGRHTGTSERGGRLRPENAAESQPRVSSTVAKRSSAFALCAAAAAAIALAIFALDPVPPEEIPVRVTVNGTGAERAARPPILPFNLPAGAVRAVLHAPAFNPQGVPAAIGRGGLPAWGNHPAGQPPHPGEFVGPIEKARGALIQVRILGELRPPETELMLRTSDGRLIWPLERTVSASGRWRRLNFPAPDGPFQIVARAAGPEPPELAFTAPIAISRAAWITGKLLRLWAPVVGLSALVALVAIWRLRIPLGEALETFPSRRGARCLPWIALLGYAVFFARHTDSTAGPNDSGGYLNSARLLASGRVSAAPRLPLPLAEARTFSPDLAAFIPGTFLPAPDGRLAPEYPSGFPLLVAGAARLLPWDLAVPGVILLQLAAGVLVTYALARTFALAPGWSLFAAAVIGLSPVYLFQALQPQSDGPALVWVALAFLTAMRATRGSGGPPLSECTAARGAPAAYTPGARHLTSSFAAGLAAGIAVLIRPSNTLALLPLLLCFAWPWRPRHLIAFISGGLPAAVWLLWYNHRLYGHALSTGYGDPAAVRAGFGLRFIAPTLHSYARWLPAFFTPLVWLAPFAPFLPIAPARARAILGSWAALFAGFYAVYWCTYDNWYNMRFLLPAAPALLILSLLAARALSARLRLPRLWLGAAAAALLALLVARAADERVLYWMHANRVHAVAARYAAAHLPPNAVVFARPAAGTLLYYTSFPVVRSDSAAAANPAFYAALARAGHPVFALTYHWEEKGFRWGRGKGTGYPDLPGHWDHLAVIGDDEMHLWRRGG